MEYETVMAKEEAAKDMETREISQVDNQMRRFESEVQRGQRLVDLLQERLSGVVEVGGTLSDGVPEPELVPLASAIRTNISVLSTTNDRIDSLLSRLQL